MEKTNLGLVEYARSQLGRPYWYGTFGQVGTEQLYLYNKKRLPSFYTSSDFIGQIGKRVHDCVGLIKGYLWSESAEGAPRYCADPCKIDHSADSMLTACVEKGNIKTLPEIPGILLFFPGHIGVYIGNGEVIEARGHAYGVVKTPLMGRGWRNWGKCPYIEYIEYVEEDNEMLSYEKFKEYMDQYNKEVSAKPEPEWSAQEGAWVIAKEKGILDGTAPESPVKRCEFAAAMHRAGLFKE